MRLVTNKEQNKAALIKTAITRCFDNIDSKAVAGNIDDFRPTFAVTCFEIFA